jgi:hypothetical protein
MPEKAHGPRSSKVCAFDHNTLLYRPLVCLRGLSICAQPKADTRRLEKCVATPRARVEEHA